MPLFRNAGWMFSSNIAIAVLGLMQASVMTRGLGLEGYGYLALVMSYAGLINDLLSFRIWEVVIRYLSEFVELGDKQNAIAIIKFGLIMSLGASTLAVTVMWATSRLVAKTFVPVPEAQILVPLYGLGLLGLALGEVWGALLRVFDRFRDIGLITLGYGVVKLALVALVISRGYGLGGVLIAIVVANILRGGMTAVVGYQTMQLKIGSFSQGTLHSFRPKLRAVLGLSINTSLNGTLKLVSTRGAPLLLGYFGSASAVGLYRLAQQIKSMLGLISAPAYATIYPEVVRRAVGCRSGDSFVRWLARLTVILGGIGGLATGAIFVLAPWLVMRVGGEGFQEAAQVVRIIVWADFCMLTLLWIQPAAIGLDKVHIANIVWAGNSAMWLLLAPVLFPTKGAVGAGIVYLLATLGAVLCYLLLLSPAIRRTTVSEVKP